MDFHAQFNCKQAFLCSKSHRSSCDPRKVLEMPNYLRLFQIQKCEQGSGFCQLCQLKMYQGGSLCERVKRRSFESLPDLRADLGGTYNVSYVGRGASLHLRRGRCISELEQTQQSFEPGVGCLC